MQNLMIQYYGSPLWFFATWRFNSLKLASLRRASANTLPGHFCMLDIVSFREQECQERVSSKSVKKECPARVSRKSAQQESPARVSSKSVSFTSALQDAAAPWWLCKSSPEKTSIFFSALVSAYSALHKVMHWGSWVLSGFVYETDFSTFFFSYFSNSTSQ